MLRSSLPSIVVSVFKQPIHKRPFMDRLFDETVHTIVRIVRMHAHGSFLLYYKSLLT